MKCFLILYIPQKKPIGLPGKPALLSTCVPKKLPFKRMYAAMRTNGLAPSPKNPNSTVGVAGPSGLQQKLGSMKKEAKREY